MNHLSTLAAAAFLLTFGSTNHRLDAQDSAKVQRPSSDLITREQIVAAKATNAYDLIEALHNNWLQERIPIPSDRNGAKIDTTGKASYNTDMLPGGRSAPGSNGGIQVYIDGSRVGGLSALKDIRPADVYSIRRLNGPEAQARFGLGHSSGVIYVSSSANTSTKSP